MSIPKQKYTTIEQVDKDFAIWIDGELFIPARFWAIELLPHGENHKRIRLKQSVLNHRLKKYISDQKIIDYANTL